VGLREKGGIADKKAIPGEDSIFLRGGEEAQERQKGGESTSQKARGKGDSRNGPWRKVNDIKAQSKRTLKYPWNAEKKDPASGLEVELLEVLV